MKTRMYATPAVKGLIERSNKPLPTYRGIHGDMALHLSINENQTQYAIDLINEYGKNLIMAHY